MIPIPDMPIRNTLGIQSRAVWGCSAHRVDDIVQALAYAKNLGLNFCLLGEGSNIVAQQRVNQFVCHQTTKGIVERNRDDETAVVSVAAGENWHSFVMRMLDDGLHGLENLALIPGSVGAAPVQNIGAYGVEAAEFIQTVEVLDEEGKVRSMPAAECLFGYRSSVFQKEPQLCITGVTFRLRTRPSVVATYPDVVQEIEDINSPHALAEAVIRIRQRKLPDPAAEPNVGSFFKNPTMSLQDASDLKKRHPELKMFEGKDQAKLSAAQLIDLCGWKAKGSPALHCWGAQPLVIVNPGRGNAADVLGFAENIRADVLARYGVHLEVEPSVLS